MLTRFNAFGFQPAKSLPASSPSLYQADFAPQNTPLFQGLQADKFCPTGNKPKFAGLTANLQAKRTSPQGFDEELKTRQRWLSPEAFEKAVEHSKSPYVGRLPAVFVQGMRFPSVEKGVKGSPKQVFQAFDELAPMLQSLAKGEHTRLRFKIGGKPVTLEKSGRGNYGGFYWMKVDNQLFGLKVSAPKVEGDGHSNFGFYSEAMAGLYLSKFRFRDMGEFLFGNPQAGWGVIGFISNEMTPELRGGPSVANYAITLGDEAPRNRINGIRVDYGGIVPQADIKRSAMEDFLNDFDADENFSMDTFKTAMNSGNAEVQQWIIGCIAGFPKRDSAGEVIYTDDGMEYTGGLPDNERWPALKMAIKTGIPEVQQTAILYFSYLSPKDKMNAFKMVMQRGNAAVQRHLISSFMYDLKGLSEPDQLKVCQTAWDTGNPDIQSSMLSQTLSSLPEAVRPKYFKLAMETGNPEVQSAAVLYNWAALPKEFVPDAFKMAMETGDTEIQRYTIDGLFTFPKKFRWEAFETALATNKAEVQKQAAERLKYLPEERHEQAIDLVMATGNPDAQKAMSYNFYGSPEALQKKIFRRLRMDGNPEAVRNGALSMGHDALCEELRNEAFQPAMDSNDPELQERAARGAHKLPEDRLDDALRQILKTGREDAQAAVIPRLDGLPEKLQRKLLRFAIDTGKPKVQKDTVLPLHFFEEGLRKEAALLGVATGNAEIQKELTATWRMKNLPEGDRAEVLRAILERGSREAVLAAAGRATDMSDEGKIEFPEGDRQELLALCTVALQQFSGHYAKDLQLELAA